MHPIEREIIELHEFFEGWLGGTLERTGEVFARVETALAPDFTIVLPDGREIARSPLLTSLDDGWGRRRGVRLEVEQARVLVESETHVLARYIERQTEGDRATSRLSTVLFDSLHATGSPGHGSTRPRWRTVHETWIDG